MTRPMARLSNTLLALASLLLIGGLLGGACADPYSACRLDPLCASGGVGASCASDRDCFDGVCCESDNCGGGMCTFACDDDRDCPPEMLCEHSTCFFICSDDRDCAVGQSCEHGNTICEWED